MSEEHIEQTKAALAEMLTQLEVNGFVVMLPDGGKALRLQHVEELLLLTVEQASSEFTAVIKTTFDSMEAELESLLPAK